MKKNLWKPVASTSSTITDLAAVATEIQDLPRMITGRPLLLPKLDSRVQEYITENCASVELLLALLWSLLLLKV